MNLTLTHFVKYQLPLIVWVLVIFSLSALPRVPAIKFPISPDKLAHAGIYFILCMFSRRAFFYQERFSGLRKHALLASFLFTVAYGILDEVHQLYVPGRWADVYDAVADAIGGFLFISWFWWRTRKNFKPDLGN